MSEQTESRPTKEEMHAIGFQILQAVKPIRDKHPGMEIIFSYSVPREKDPRVLATAFAHTFDDKDPRTMLTRLLEQLATLINDGKAGQLKSESIRIDE